MAPKKYYLPSEIRTDHRDNSSRAALYQVCDVVPEIADAPNMADAFCFSRAQVDQRLASLLAKGQLTPVRVYLTKGKNPEPVLLEGFLRHSAALLAEVTGKLDDISQPSTARGLRVMVVPAPTTSENLVSNMWANKEENDERLDRTALDTAWLIKRALQMQCSKEEIGRELNMSVRAVNRHRSLLSLPITDQIDMHEGRKTMSELLDSASAKGTGTSRGTRAGVKHTIIRNAFRAITEQGHSSDLVESDTLYTAQDVLATIAHIGGIDDASDEAHGVPAEILAFLDAPKPVKRKAGRPKKVAVPGLADTLAAYDAGNIEVDRTPKAKPAKAASKKAPARKKTKPVKGDGTS